MRQQEFDREIPRRNQMWLNVFQAICFSEKIKGGGAQLWDKRGVLGSDQVNLLKIISFSGGVKYFV